MVSKWTVGDLDPDRLFEVKISQDLETATRFSLPIPSWLDEDGKPVESVKNHPNIFWSERKGEYRFKFTNFVDGCEQGVKIDGTGVILFMTPTVGQTKELLKIIHDVAPAFDRILPDQVQRILERSYDELGLLDRYNASHSDLDNRMRATDNVSNRLGSYVYKDEISTAIYIHGQGVFADGPAISDQSFDEGGFIVFPGKKISEVQKIIKKYQPRQKRKIGAKIVGRAEFLKTRRDLNGRPIKLFELDAQTEPKKRYYTPQPLPGFPEFSPETYAVERNWIEKIRGVFNQYGFPEMGLRSMEPLQVLRGGNEEDNSATTRRIFSVRRDFERASLGLRYDLTVPLARHVAENVQRIQFPFKSARIGSVWRGDKAMSGRFREFTQADVDVVGRRDIPIEYDAEIVRIAANATAEMDIGPIEIGLSNRKILQGFLQSLGLDNKLIVNVIRVLDKRHRIGEEGITEALMDQLGLDAQLTSLCVKISSIRSNDGSFYEQVIALGQDSPLLREGLDELSHVVQLLENVEGVVADLSIARGLDYYTGTVIEGKFAEMPHLPPILGGGRYDNLVRKFMPEAMPGVGVSIGVTRILSLLEKEGKLVHGASTPTQLLLAYQNEEELRQVENHARELRNRGISCEIVYGADRKRQLDYAGKKGIPYVLFLTKNPESPTEIRDMHEPDRESPAKQFPVDLSSWRPEKAKLG